MRTTLLVLVAALTLAARGDSTPKQSACASKPIRASVAKRVLNEW